VVGAAYKIAANPAKRVRYGLWKWARESGADESEAAFVATVKAISSTKPKKKRSQEDR
jgi:hypothetical protein